MGAFLLNASRREKEKKRSCIFVQMGCFHWLTRDDAMHDVREKPERDLLPVTVEIARTLPPVYSFPVWKLCDYIHFLTIKSILSIKSYRRQ